jgi:hypothetical protein
MQQQAVTAVFEYGWLMLEQDSQGHYMMFWLNLLSEILKWYMYVDKDDIWPIALHEFWLQMYYLCMFSRWTHHRDIDTVICIIDGNTM